MEKTRTGRETGNIQDLKMLVQKLFQHTPGLHLPALPFRWVAELFEIQSFCRREQFVRASNVFSFTFPEAFFQCNLFKRQGRGVLYIYFIFDKSISCNNLVKT